jgi:hypothetical protein
MKNSLICFGCCLLFKDKFYKIVKIKKGKSSPKAEMNSYPIG